MPASTTRIATASASAYLVRLCKHWSHKFTIEYTPERGMIPFDADRRCYLEADPDALNLRVEAPDGETLERTQDVVIKHLLRFSFKEELGAIAWAPAEPVEA